MVVTTQKVKKEREKEKDERKNEEKENKETYSTREPCTHAHIQKTSPYQ